MQGPSLLIPTETSRRSSRSAQERDSRSRSRWVVRSDGASGQPGHRVSRAGERLRPGDHEAVADELGPLTSSRVVKAILPSAFPTITPDQLDLGTLVGDGSLAATLTLVGTAKTNASACLAEATFEAPAGTSIKTRPQQDPCVEITGADTQSLNFTITSSKAVDGLGSGQINLILKSNRNGESIQVAVPVQFDLERPVDQGKLWLFVVLLTLLALALPLLILVASDYLLLRFLVTPMHQIARVPVLIDESGIRRQDDPARLLRSSDLMNVPESKERRARAYSSALLSASFQARGIANVFRGSKAHLVAPPGAALLSGARPHIHDEGRSAPASFGTADAWYVTSAATNAPAAEGPSMQRCT